MRVSEILKLFGNREIVSNAFLDALPRFFGDVTVKEISTRETTVRVTEGLAFLAVYPSVNHGDWFLVKNSAPRFIISEDSYKKAVTYDRNTNTVTIISVGPPQKRVIEVPPL